MKIYAEGDKSKALCERDGVVDTTFLYRDVAVEGCVETARILAGVCDRCGATLTMAQQSAAAVKAVRDRAAGAVEAHLPAA